MRTLCAGALAAGVLCGALSPVAVSADGTSHAFVPASSVGHAVQAAQAAGSAGLNEPPPGRPASPGTTPYSERPWIEGYEPAREDELFRATYPVLPEHNILKIYVSDAGSYDAAGIRFSARVPHTVRDIDAEEMQHEAAVLIRTAFERFPDLQALDVWATIPIEKRALTTVESTVFSVSADRPTYLSVRSQALSDEAFLAAFGKVWLAPQVPR